LTSILIYFILKITALDFPDESYNVVFCKAAIDAILCGENSTANVSKALSEISRVLKPNGTFICVSYGTTESRLLHFDKEDKYSWKVKVLTIPKPTITATNVPAVDDASGVHYIYICHKAGPTTAGDE
jgi:SAM-dependent methyltransferase